MANANRTYNNSINFLKRLGAAHDQITTTTTGDIFKVDMSIATLFPLMHVNTVNVTTGQTSLKYNFQIFICDLVGEKENWTEANFESADYLSNEQEVLSSCLQICTDIIAMLSNSKWQSANNDRTQDINSPVYFTEGEYTLEPFTERFDNLVTGWVFSIPIVVQNDFQACEIPVENVSLGH
tara:strand:+ start:1182 stop:1724 length:543 start_codon:yes stop_codon:yes gene_type:complete